MWPMFEIKISCFMTNPNLYSPIVKGPTVSGPTVSHPTLRVLTVVGSKVSGPTLNISEWFYLKCSLSEWTHRGVLYIMIGPTVSEHTVSGLTGEGPIKSYLIVSIFTGIESDSMKNL